jgi:hypothetical protein
LKFKKFSDFKVKNCILIIQRILKNGCDCDIIKKTWKCHHNKRSNKIPTETSKKPVRGPDKSAKDKRKPLSNRVWRPFLTFVFQWRFPEWGFLLLFSFTHFLYLFLGSGLLNFALLVQNFKAQNLSENLSRNCEPQKFP